MGENLQVGVDAEFVEAVYWLATHSLLFIQPRAQSTFFFFNIEPRTTSPDIVTI